MVDFYDYPNIWDSENKDYQKGYPMSNQNSLQLNFNDNW
jgi:hypothetical protein